MHSRDDVFVHSGDNVFVHSDDEVFVHLGDDVCLYTLEMMSTNACSYADASTVSRLDVKLSQGGRLMRILLLC